MTIELPAGLRSRAANPADAQAIYELMAACELEADGVAEVDIHDLTGAFVRHGFDPGLDSILVFEGDEPVGWAELYRGRGEGDVRPSHRGRGIGAALVSWIEARARELGEASIGQTKTDADTSARALFLAKGYEPRWTSWVIRIQLDAPPSPPDVPPGISIRPYRASDVVDVHRVIDASFSEWEGRDPEPFEVWASQVPVHPGFRPDLSPLAFDGDELVGVVIAYDFPELGEGWIQQLATRATHRRRGIAQAMLRTSFGWFHEAGRRVMGVSTDSRTGALGLYEKVGMRVVRQYTKYAKRLR
ncbi:MAG: GNAT family N-acetyltransferase [Actinomycetota bacterium]